MTVTFIFIKLKVSSNPKGFKRHTYFELNSNRVLDINTPEDFKMAEISMSFKEKKLI